MFSTYCVSSLTDVIHVTWAARDQLGMEGHSFYCTGQEIENVLVSDLGIF